MARPGITPKILIVDDDIAFLSRLRSVLRNSGYHVLTATSGGEAIELVHAHLDEILVVIVELFLPGRPDGFELIGSIMRLPNPVKVLAMSSVLQDADLFTVLRCGGQAVLRKPQKPSGIVERDWVDAVQCLLERDAVKVGAA